MKQNTMKLWIGLGSCLVVANAGPAAAAASPAEPMAQPRAALADALRSGGAIGPLADASGEAGEKGHHGGEAGEKGHHHGGEGGGEGGESGERGHRHGGEAGEKGHHGGEAGEKSHHGGEAGESSEKGHHGGESGEGGERGGHSMGGEGGEGGEGGGLADLPPEQGYAVSLLQMKGHLTVAKQLYDAGHREASLPHFGHPLAEHFEEIEPTLKRHGVSGLEQQLHALSDAVTDKKGEAAVDKAYQETMAAIDAAIGKIDASTRETPAFAHGVVLGVLKAAEAEYAEAVKDDRITDAAEYQDSRGFVWVARDYARQNAETLKARNAESYKELMAQLDTLAKAWPTPTPPKQAVFDIGKVYAGVSRVELMKSDFQ